MSKYVVLRLQGKQYKVFEGDSFYVDKMSDKKLKPEVLLVVNEDKVKVGRPVIGEAKLKIKVLNEDVKGEKLDIFKYKSKSRYRKHLGFRPRYTNLLLEEVA
jgi:large subunit ribosomal protein L21